MKKKSLITKGISLAMAAMLTLSACGSGGGESSKKEDNSSKNESNVSEVKVEQVEIDFWTMQLSPTFDDYLNDAIARFEEENPDIKVNWVDVPWGDMESKILAEASAKTMPDVANLNPHFAQKLAQMGALADMDELAADVKDDYIPGAWKASSYEGKTFALPWYLTTSITFYNKDLFEQAGLDPETPPTTFDEIYEMAKTIKEKTGKYGYMPVFSTSDVMMDFEKAGVTLFNDDYSEATYASAEAKELAEFYKKMFDEDLIPRDVLTEGTGKAIQLFSSGEVAIFQGGTSHASMIESNSAEVFAKTGIGAQPLGKGEKGKINFSVMNVAVAETSPNKEQAARFAKFITNDENQVEFAKVSGAIVPSTLASLDDDFFKLTDTPKDVARTISAQQIAKGEVIFPPIKNWSEVSKVFIDSIAKIMTGNQDVATALEEAQKEANELLAE